MTKEDVIKEFTKIKGVSKAKAELLYSNGFNSLEKLKKATAKDLVKIDGITENNAKNILKQIEVKAETKTTKTKVSKKEKIEKTPKKAEKKSAPKAKPKKIDEKIKKSEEKKIEAIEEKGEYKVKIKPKLSKELVEKLKIRKQIKNRTPEFLRQEWFRYKKLSKTWRKPDGMTSKMRIHLKYRPITVRVGFRGPRDTRGLHSSGFEEVIVFNVNDLERIAPYKQKQAVRIGSSVGTRKRMDIKKKAEELDIRILNM